MEKYWVCPDHLNTRYSDRGSWHPEECGMLLPAMRECSMCGEKNPKEGLGLHLKPGCGGLVVTKREFCNKPLGLVKLVQELS